MRLLGKKLGMTRVYADKGVAVPVTAIQVGPCVVTQLRTKEKDGYTAVQIGFEDIKPRNSTIPMIGHDAKAGTPQAAPPRVPRATQKDWPASTLGQTLTVKDLEGIMFVDVIGQSKGKGFAGTMKRHHFKGLFASHGTERKHRSPGSIGSLCSHRGFGGGVKKGKSMAGHMGDERVTARSLLDVVRIDADKHILLVKGSVPGANNGLVVVRPGRSSLQEQGKKVAGQEVSACRESRRRVVVPVKVGRWVGKADGLRGLRRRGVGKATPGEPERSSATLNGNRRAATSKPRRRPHVDAGWTCRVDPIRPRTMVRAATGNRPRRRMEARRIGEAEASRRDVGAWPTMPPGVGRGKD